MENKIKVELEPIADTISDDLKTEPLNTESFAAQTLAYDTEGILVKNEINFCTSDDENGSPHKTTIPHPQINKSTHKSIFCCKNCDFKTGCNLLYKHHMTTGGCVTLTDNVNVPEGEIEVAMYITCSECNYITPSRIELEKHSLFHKQGKVRKRILKCTKCSFITTLNKRLQQHLVKHRDKRCKKLNFNENMSSSYIDLTNNNRLKCKDCDFLADTHDSFIFHLQQCHSELYFECDSCKTLIKSKHKKSHMLFHIPKHLQGYKKIFSKDTNVVSNKLKPSKNCDIVNQNTLHLENCSTSIPMTSSIVNFFKTNSPIDNRIISCLPSNNSNYLSTSVNYYNATEVNTNSVIIYNTAPLVSNAVINTASIQNVVSLTTSNRLYQNVLITETPQNSVLNTQSIVCCTNNQINPVGVFQTNVTNAQLLLNNYVTLVSPNLALNPSVPFFNNYVSDGKVPIVSNELNQEPLSTNKVQKLRYILPKVTEDADLLTV